MLYLASGNMVKKWTQRYRNWDYVLNPANRSLRRAFHPVFVNANASIVYYITQLLLPYSIDISSIARNPQSYSEGRVWAKPTEISLYAHRMHWKFA